MSRHKFSLASNVLVAGIVVLCACSNAADQEQNADREKTLAKNKSFLDTALICMKTVSIAPYITLSGAPATSPPRRPGMRSRWHASPRTYTEVEEALFLQYR
jgi:hypothetical protein